jgi:hypothetical protein
MEKDIQCAQCCIICAIAHPCWLSRSLLAQTQVSADPAPLNPNTPITPAVSDALKPFGRNESSDSAEALADLHDTGSDVNELDLREDQVMSIDNPKGFRPGYDPRYAFSFPALRVMCSSSVVRVDTICDADDSFCCFISVAHRDYKPTKSRSQDEESTTTSPVSPVPPPLSAPTTPKAATLPSGITLSPQPTSQAPTPPGVVIHKRKGSSYLLTPEPDRPRHSDDSVRGLPGTRLCVFLWLRLLCAPTDGQASEGGSAANQRQAAQVPQPNIHALSQSPTPWPALLLPP